MRTLIAPATALVVFGLAVFGQDGPIESRTELRRSLAAARTPADHARLADYYYKAASAYDRQQKEEEQIAARWEKQYRNWTKTPNPWRSAMNLAEYYRRLANDALSNARIQDSLAGTGAGPEHQNLNLAARYPGFLTFFL